MEIEELKERGFDIAIPQVTVTERRKPFIQRHNDIKLKQAGTARANEAASYEAPHGTEKGDYAYHNRDKTVLQQHISFFDPDKDGIIWPLDTFNGFRRLGIIPDPFFRIYVARIHKDKHGSDSGSYDPEGRFEPQKFEDIFAKYASGDKQGITLVEITRYIRGQSVLLDPFGWFGAIFEYGRMMKEDIRRIFDGSLFYEISARRMKSN